MDDDDERFCVPLVSIRDIFPQFKTKYLFSELPIITRKALENTTLIILKAQVSTARSYYSVDNSLFIYPCARTQNPRIQS